VKNVCASILALVYLFCTIGASIQQHYCMGELVKTSLFGAHKDECAKCGMQKHTEANKDCCKDIFIFVKGGDCHTFSQAVYAYHSISYILPAIQFISYGLKIPQIQIENLYRAHSPPLLSCPLFLQFRNFRI
jgi:hypothetical protein